MLGSWKKTKPRAVVAVLVAVIAALILGPAAPTMATPVSGFEANYSGYGTGTNVYLGLLNDASGDEEAQGIVANAGFATASTASKGLVNRIRNEMNVEVQPPLPAKKAFGRGVGLELGSGGDEGNGGGGGEDDLLGGLLGGDGGQLLEQEVTAVAPPSTGLLQEDLLELDLDPIAYARLLVAQAQARNEPDNPCILGKDISFGRGYAADVQLLDLGGDEPDENGDGDNGNALNDLLDGLLNGSARANQNGEDDNGGLEEPLLATSASRVERAAVNAQSRMVLVPQVNREGRIIGDGFGLMAEVRQTVAPVTLFKDTSDETTVELLGEWRLRVVAGGIRDSAFIHFGPADESPDTPVLRIVSDGDDDGDEDESVLSFEDIFGDEGLDLDLGILGLSIVGLRAIRGGVDTDPQIAQDGTSASAAIDVVRLVVGEGLDEGDNGGLGTLLEVIVGHFEAAVRVPEGGIDCPLKVNKVGIPDQINGGETFTTEINVINPYDCDLTDLRVEDVINTTGSARFTVNEISDGGQFTGNDRSGTINWSLGTLGAKQSRKISVKFTGLGVGTITDKATARGTCALGSAVGETTVNVGLKGEGSTTVRVGRGRLPVTGGPGWLFVGTALVMSAAGAIVGRKALRMLFGGARI